MKNLTSKLLLIVCLLAPLSKVSAQRLDKDDVSHWSLALKGGTNYFRVYPFSGDRGDRFGWFPALSLDYTVNPIWGFGLEAAFHNYGDHYDGVFKYQGQSLDILAIGNVNLTNLFSPVRAAKWGGYNLYLEAGAGFNMYRYNPDNTDYGDFKFAPAASIGLTMEIPLGQMWALDIGGQYRMYYTENMGGEALGKYRDYTDGLTASLGLRYKFGAFKKPHVRNLTQNEFYPAPSPVVVVEDGVSDDVMRRLASSESQNRDQQQRIQRMEQELRMVKENANKYENIPTSVPNIANLVVENIEFKLNQKDLTAGDKAILDQVAAILLNNMSAWKSLEILGYTDATGAQSLNLSLSETRANLVATYLMSKGIPRDRINKIHGYGEINPIASNSTVEGRNKNRRVEVNIVK